MSTQDLLYGKSKVARWYFQDVPGIIPTDRDIIVSFKTLVQPSLIHRGKRTFYRHEIDHEILTVPPEISLPIWIADMNRMQLTDVCLTANCFVNPKKNPANFILSNTTHIGVDFDGISYTTHYHDYTSELNAVVAFTKAHGLTWGVPEFGADRATAIDPDGQQRARWMAEWCGKFQDAGAEYVCFWEQDSIPTSTFTTPAELAAVRMALAI